MKRYFLSFLMMAVMVGAAFGQSDHGYNLYGQFTGPSTGVGIGFDSRFKTGGVLGYSVGVAFTDTSWSDNYGDEYYSYKNVDSSGVSIPLEVNAIMGKRASKFEVGLGVTAFLIHRDEYYYKSGYMPAWGYEAMNYWSTIENKSVFRPNIIGSINIGYRLQRKSGFFMKLGLSLLIGDLKCSPIDGVMALPNICLGYTVPHF